ncbi:aspartyl protease family protein 2-like [Glycine soja]|uniref:Aspartic proteinase NANA, chloroplast n=1 Tax=Glycine soja TaxID=3848 RepID=A0A445LM57_GLYSO|nr:aspartyl protease family protein 2-like [Glycine soja]RZC24265.1 Aspartic proteinase NANA, chloroplast [Glycine soja]
MSSHPSLFSLFFFLLLSLPQHSFSSTEEYLKLPLLPRTPLPSPSHLLAADLRRLSANSPLTSGAPTGSGQYFASLRLGSPPQRLLLVADTGSDLIWVKCSGCRRNCSSTAFLPRHSASFSPHHCYDSPCQLVPHPPSPKNHLCNNHTKLHTPCHYQYSYADGSTSTGFFSKETISLNTTNSTRQTRLNKLSFGCAFRTSGPSVTGHSFNGAQGVMGLGRGPISFTSQLARKLSNTKTKNTFSYCLLDYTLSPPPTSYLTIGPTPNDVVSRNSFTYTPLLTNPFSPSFYYISIQSVSVDGVRLPISESVFRIDANGNGGTVVDSGTTLSFLAEPAYGKILAAFRRRVRLPAVESAAALGFDLCVNVSGVARPKLPRLRFRLAGKAVLSPPVGNYFIEPAEGVKCLAVQPVRPDSGFSVIGNLMQQGYLFEFDLDRSRIGFTRHGCAVR